MFLFACSDLSSYLIYQEEIGESGTHHYQGYLELITQKRVSHVKRLLAGGGVAHIEKCVGTQEENIKYCSKEKGRVSGPFIHGTKAKAAGGSVGVTNIIAGMKRGDSLQQIIEDNPKDSLKYSSGIKFFATQFGPKRDWKTIVTVYWGPPGTGKSFKAHLNRPDAYKMPKSGNNNVWFDGYDKQETIIMDDFYGWIPLTFMLELMDAYPMRLPIKGGFVPMLAKEIIITSNRAPEHWYEKAFLSNPNHKEAFMRRIENVGEFTAFKTYKVIHPAEEIKQRIQGEHYVPYEGKQDEHIPSSVMTSCSICAEDISICQGQCIRQLGESPQPIIDEVTNLTALMSMRIPVSNSEYFYCSESLDVNQHEIDLDERRRWSKANQMYQENGNGFKVRGVCGTQLDRKYVCNELLVL